MGVVIRYLLMIGGLAALQPVINAPNFGVAQGLLATSIVAVVVGLAIVLILVEKKWPNQEAERRGAAYWRRMRRDWLVALALIMAWVVFRLWQR